MDALLDPFPHGWYVLAESRDIARNQHKTRTWMGREIIIWRDQSAGLLVADAFCPHLGAHLGPEAGGLLKDNRLVCPFHGFEYAASGKCVKVTAGPAPSAIKLASYPVQEVNGYIYAYYDREQREPAWSIPDVSEDGCAHRAINKRRIRAHPQITSENSVDWAHLAYLHGYDNLKQRQASEIDGPILKAYYAFDRRMTGAFLRSMRFRFEIDVSVWGLGVSTVKVRGAEIGFEARQWMLATPVDGEHIDYWLATDTFTAPRLLGLHRLPEAFLLPMLSKLLTKELVTEVSFDERVWSSMAYQASPSLCQADRDISRFRRYCQQFYPVVEQ